MVNKYHNKGYVKSGGKPKGSVRKKAKISKLDEYPRRGWGLVRRSEQTSPEILGYKNEEADRAQRIKKSREKKAWDSRWVGDTSRHKAYEKMYAEDTEVEKINRMLEEKYPTESFPANQRKRMKRARNGNKN